ncbi:MAG TPA: FxLYD domain-containing protein [Verrucomicrobiae bacterium]
MSVAQELKCACPHCNGRIAYPATAGGSTIQCPHCAKPVALPATVAPVAAAPVPVASQPNLKCACRHCNGRISFPANAAGSAIPCPHCGKETPLIAPGVSAAAAPIAATAAAPHAPAPAAPVAARPKVATPPVPTEEELAEAPAKKSGGGKKVMMIVGIVLAVAILAGGAMVVLKKKGSGGGGLSLLGAKEDLQVVNYELQKNQGTSLVYVTGKLKNNTEAQHTSVRVDFKLFDSAGKQIGIAGDYIMILEPKSEWEFKALVVEPEVTKVEVDKITSSK